MNKIRYSVTATDPHAHLFTVSLSISPINDKPLHLSLPAWIPGSYMIRDFAKHIIDINALDKQGPLEYTKQDKQTWQVKHRQQTVTVTYRVYAWDLSVRAAHLDATHGFFNGTSLFLAIDGYQHYPCEVMINKPEGSQFQQWKVATGLPRAQDTKKYEFGSYLAKDYAQLIDCPVEMANFSHIDFTLDDIVHHLIFTGKNYGDLPRVARDVKKICKHHLALFSKPADLTEYWFLTYITDNGFGGLEHSNSTALICSRFDLPNKKQPKKLDNGYQTFLSLCSHEYFHTWNVKRIKPQTYFNYDLTKETYTDQLWAYEGFTSYYDDLALLRTGLIGRQTYLTLLEKTITRVYRSTGRHKQTIAESSFDAWTKFYKQDENAQNAIISYYTKGALIALCLDLTLRSQQPKSSLDKAMKILWKNHGIKAKGTEFSDFVKIFNQIAHGPMETLLYQLVYTTDELPLIPLLQQVGIQLTFKSTTTSKKNRELQTKDSHEYPINSLEIDYKSQSLGLLITQVFDNGAAQQAGLSAKDILLAIDNIKVTADNLPLIISNLPEGQTVDMVIFRQDNLLILPLTLKPAITYFAQLTIIDTAKVQLWLPVDDNHLDHTQSLNH